ncbi:response regulator transcription factor [Chitinophaga japonensis]|uniref:Helix-turn-helix protein n=1 Tax=Chitinophaga japonensis TaxID=104662 RepID=A0A562T2R6_CHIJA|nr:response regulator [Chitinophaga japonensis]TWI87862.1 helix-turn-helix protein [Chitinophaga japonensis]
MRPTLLIVDDNKEILEFVQEILGAEYDVIQTTDARKALEVLATAAVQLVISDVMMPEMDGFEFCKMIKSNLEYCHIPVILLTAKNTLMSRIEGLELGADAYIDKPFSPRHLKVQVANLIANRNMIREYFAHSPLAHIKTMAGSKADELFLEQLNDIILQHLDNLQLDGEFLAEALNMSRSTLYRKIKAISNLTIHELINLARLKKAAELLAEGTYRVFEVSNITGFSSPNHFNRIFFRQFGMSPTGFMKRNGRGGNSAH